MFLIDRDNNEAISLSKRTFQELNFKERQHLQEWICKNTDILGERLLIIQKEFSGFDDTRERLDLQQNGGSSHVEVVSLLELADDLGEEARKELI